jgi:hypothetical protein
MVRQKSLAAESPGNMNAQTDAPRIVITDLYKTRSHTSFPPARKYRPCPLDNPVRLDSRRALRVNPPHTT